MKEMAVQPRTRRIAVEEHHGRAGADIGVRQRSGRSAKGVSREARGQESVEVWAQECGGTGEATVGASVKQGGHRLVLVGHGLCLGGDALPEDARVQDLRVGAPTQ